MSIAVTGIGIISAIGNNAEETLLALRQGRSGIATMRHLQSSHKELPVGEVKLSDEEMKTSLGIAPDEIISRTALLGAMAIREAAPSLPKDKRCCIISGTTVGGMDVTERIFQNLNDTPELLPYIKKHDCGSNTQDMAKLLNIDSSVCTVSTACSSALNAIILACEMLKNNETDIVIAGGSEALSRFHLNGFNSLLILDKEPCRPFDATRAGLNLGEGAAYIILQRSEDADAKDIKAYITGYGNRCDAFHQTASSENGEGAFLAMNDAIQMANLNPSDIQYVNAHGTGTPNNDASESAALRRIFTNAMPPVSSTKAFTGHTTSASGAIETVISIIAMQQGFIPRNINWQSQDDNCITPYTKEDSSESIDNVLCNSFGFGGNDSAIIISRQQAVDEAQHAYYESEVAADVIIDNTEQLTDYKEYISPMAARRMGKLIKAATLTSLKALQQAGIESPDAIITATAYGMLETSEKFLSEMIFNGEQSLSPTLFMQSTHNTIGSAIAIRTKCHGYNTTYTQGADSMEWAMKDAKRLIATGKAETVLVGCHDESTETFQNFMKQLGCTIPPTIYSRSIVLRRKKG